MLLDEVPLETAVRLMAELANLKPVRLGNVLFVTSEDRADKLKADTEVPMPLGGGFGVEDRVMPARPLPAAPMVPVAPPPPPPPALPAKPMAMR